VHIKTQDGFHGADITPATGQCPAIVLSLQVCRLPAKRWILHAFTRCTHPSLQAAQERNASLSLAHAASGPCLVAVPGCVWRMTVDSWIHAHGDAVHGEKCSRVLQPFWIPQRKHRLRGYSFYGPRLRGGPAWKTRKKLKHITFNDTR
jgi:hypothetical protein